MLSLFYRRQKGATLVEFALVASLIFALIFSIIFVGRHFFIKNFLRESSKRISRQASVEFAFRPNSVNPTNLTSEEKIDWNNRRVAILDRAINFATISLSNDTNKQSGSFRLSYYRMPGLSPGDPVLEKAALLLLPGQRAERVMPNGSIVPVVHPSCYVCAHGKSCPEIDSACPGLIARAQGGDDQAWDQMLRLYPIYTELSTFIPSFLFGDLGITESSTVWHEAGPSGGSVDASPPGSPPKQQNPDKNCHAISATQYCNTCRDSLAYKGVTEDNFDDVVKCEYNPGLTNCGRCYMKRCRDIFTFESICGEGGRGGTDYQPDCGDDRYCQLLGWRRADPKRGADYGCARCLDDDLCLYQFATPSSGSSGKNAACASISCPNEDCYYYPYNNAGNGEICVKCVPDCRDLFTGIDDFCAQNPALCPSDYKCYFKGNGQVLDTGNLGVCVSCTPCVTEAQCENSGKILGDDSCSCVCPPQPPPPTDCEHPGEPKYNNSICGWECPDEPEDEDECPDDVVCNPTCEVPILINECDACKPIQVNCPSGQIPDPDNDPSSGTCGCVSMTSG